MYIGYVSSYHRILFSPQIKACIPFCVFVERVHLHFHAGQLFGKVYAKATSSSSLPAASKTSRYLTSPRYCQIAFTLCKMANTVPSYFYSPSWDYPPPPTGPIKLGSLITSLKRPEQPLATSDPTSTFSTDKKIVEFSKEKLRQGKFSILTKFLSVLGVGVDLGAEREKR